MTDESAPGRGSAGKSGRGGPGGGGAGQTRAAGPHSQDPDGRRGGSGGARITLQDVANRAGVSLSTASRVVSDYFGGAFSSRLNEKIRVEKGLTYGAGGGYSASRFAGRFTVHTFSKTDTTGEAVKAMRMYGATIEERENNIFRVSGVAGKLQTPEDIVNVNNSGTMLVFLAGVAAACALHQLEDLLVIRGNRGD